MQEDRMLHAFALVHHVRHQSDRLVGVYGAMAEVLNVVESWWMKSSRQAFEGMSFSADQVHELVHSPADKVSACIQWRTEEELEVTRFLIRGPEISPELLQLEVQLDPPNGKSELNLVLAIARGFDEAATGEGKISDDGSVCMTLQFRSAAARRLVADLITDEEGNQRKGGGLFEVLTGLVREAVKGKK